MRGLSTIFLIFSLSAFGQGSITGGESAGNIVDLNNAIYEGVYGSQFNGNSVTGYIRKGGSPLAQTKHLTSEQILMLYQGGLSDNGAPLELNDVYFKPDDLALSHLPIQQQMDFQRMAFGGGLDVALDSVLPINNSLICPTKNGTNPNYGNLLGAIQVDDEGFLIPITLDELCSHPLATGNQRNCGYSMSFSMREIQSMCRMRNALVEHGPNNIPDNYSGDECHRSNCTTASFMGIVNLLRTRTDIYPHLSSDLKCNMSSSGGFRGWGAIYDIYKEGNGLRNVVSYLNNELTDDQGNSIDFGATFHETSIPMGARGADVVAELDRKAAQGIPSAGDPIQIDRPPLDGRRASGHAAIFSNYRRNEGGMITHICYWTSNQGGSGTGLMHNRNGERPIEGQDGGNRCERIFKNDGTTRITNLGSASGLGGSVQVVPATTIAQNGI